MTQSTWEAREVPLLEAVAQGEAEGVRVDTPWLLERTGKSGGDVGRGIQALAQAKYVVVNEASSFGDDVPFFLEVLLAERGRRTVGSWPSDDRVDALLELLDERIATEPDNAARGALTKLKDALKDVPVQVGTALLTAYLKAQVGI